MRLNRIIRCIRYGVFVLIAAAAVSEGMAHGGEDHGEAPPVPTSVPSATANRLTTYSTTEQFELLIEYPPPEVGKETNLTFYLADYATNRAIERASFLTAFSPSGVTIVHSLQMRTPGIYDMTVIFPSDGVFSLVGTVTAESRTDFIEVRNIYAGRNANQFIAEQQRHENVTAVSSGNGLSWWWGAAIAIGGGLLGVAITAVSRTWQRRRADDRPSVTVQQDNDSGEIIGKNKHLEHR